MDPETLEHLNALLDDDSELQDQIRDQVSELDKKMRTLSGTLNKIHSTPPQEIPSLLNSVKPVLESCKQVHEAMASLVPSNQFWRWRGMWYNSLRTNVFVAALVQYLSDRTLISLEDTRNKLGIKLEWKDRYALPVEDYLLGIITLVNELSRLAVNSVTMQNFEEPIRISIFVKDVFAGFSMLNLKNDILRRRYDSLKYDMKKIEEVVYDVSLRKLAPPPQAT